MIKKLSLFCLYMLIQLLYLEPALAQTVNKNTAANDKVSSPETLELWSDWIKADKPEWNCTKLNQSFECLWPGKIKFALSDSRGKFSINAESFLKSKLPLPSRRDISPSNVKITNEKNEEIPVILEVSNDQVYVLLPKGKFIITGDLRWTQLPSELPLPEPYGILEITGTKGATARRHVNNIILETAKVDLLTNAQRLSVFRFISDNSPITVKTLLKLQVSGRTRTESLGNFIPKDFKLINIESSLEYKFNNKGNLTLQLEPGSHEVTLTAVAHQPVTKINFHQNKLSWYPEFEYISWEPKEHFRTSEIKNLSPIDPSNTEIPAAWQQLATFVRNKDQHIEFEQLKRGEERKPNANLNIQRNLWLDFTGETLTSQETINGTISKISRLNAVNGNEIARAEVNGRQKLITRDPATALAGIELRDNNVNITATSKINRVSSIFASGWATTVDNLSINLMLPPAWKLLAVPGASSVKGSWLESWDLFDFFFIILIIAAAYKILGFKSAFIICLFLVFSFNEHFEPRYILSAILILLTLKKIIDNKTGNFYKIVNITFFVMAGIFTIQLLHFVKLQFTKFLFPQISNHLLAGLSFGLGTLGNNIHSTVLLLLSFFIAISFFFLIKNSGKIVKIITFICFGATAVILLISASLVKTYYHNDTEYPMVLSDSSGSSSPRIAQEDQALPLSGMGSMLKSYDRLERAPLQKNAQAGVAIPQWHWKKATIYVTGPVDASHQISFVLLSPFFTRLTYLLQSILSLALIALLFSRLNFPKISIKPLATLVAGLLLLNSNVARADYPPQYLLTELEVRQQKELCLADSCSTITQVNFDVNFKKITIKIKASSQGQSAIAIPGPLSNFTPQKVLVDEQEISTLRRHNDFLYVALSPGQHNVTVTGLTPETETFDLSFQQKPLITFVKNNGWSVDGINSAGFIEKMLRFTRTASGNAKNLEGSEPDNFTPWLTMNRQIEIGERIDITTNVTRLGNLDRVIKVKLPIFPNENIISKGLIVKNDFIEAEFGKNQSALNFNSYLKTAPEISLPSRKGFNVTEAWNIRCRDFVTCKFSGLPSAENNAGEYFYSYLPLIGEKLKIKITPLKLVEKNSIIIENAFQNITWGTNLQQLDFSLTAKTTQQNDLTLKIPLGFEINNILLNQRSGFGVIKNEQITFQLSPGNHNITVTASKKWLPKFKEEAPQIKSSAALNNITVNVNTASQRWIVWTSGSTFTAPAILFWAKLFLIFFIIHALRTKNILRVSAVTGLLLAVGLCTISTIEICIVLAWLILLTNFEALDQLSNSKHKLLAKYSLIILGLISLGIFYMLIYSGLLLNPPMIVLGNNSNYEYLSWFFDHSATETPASRIYSLPIWHWRVLSMFWSAWLVFILFSWLRKCLVLIRNKQQSATSETTSE